MERIDFIVTREDVVANIRTLYSYLNGDFGDDYKAWAVDKMKRGHNFVVEIIDGMVCFGPSRFVGYLNNTKDKHEQNHGNGTETDSVLRLLYYKSSDSGIDDLFQKELAKHNETSGKKKYWIPLDMSLETVLNVSGLVSRKYWIARLTSDDYWNQALEGHYWLMQQRYGQQTTHIVTQLLELVSKVKEGDVLLLSYGNTIHAYGYAVECKYTTKQISSLKDVIEKRSYDYYSGIVRYKETNVFYEDLEEGCDNWGQRIMVDLWHCYLDPSSVSTNGINGEVRNGNPRTSICEVSAKFGQQKVKELEKQYNKANMFISNTAQLLQKKHNIILQGAPGTGKTYNTAAIALTALGVTDVDLSNHAEVMKRYDSLLDSQIFFTTFHQSLDYEDFVEGLKPRVRTDKDGNVVGIEYETVDGIFKRACQAVENDDTKDIVECIDLYIQSIKGYANRKEIPTVSGKSSLYVWWNEGNTTISTRSKNSNSTREGTYSPSPLNIEKIKLQAQGKGYENNWQQYAQAFIEAVKKEYNAKKNKPVVLIIDEINRGNVSKIFGELITLLESDKRDNPDYTGHPIKVTLPYSQTLFGVPSNLYIIGTMNTTDRSTGTLDYALRRRFAFVTLKSDVTVIEKHYDALCDEALKRRAVSLFNDIYRFISDPGHLTGDYDIDDLMVGHSYFMADSEEDLSNRIEYEVLPLIAEYINDGILSVKTSEKEMAFDAWRNLEPIAEADEEEQ